MPQFKVRPGVNFTNNLGAAFEPIFFYQKNTNPNCIHREATQNTFVQKSYLQNVDEIDTFSQPDQTLRFVYSLLKL